MISKKVCLLFVILLTCDLIAAFEDNDAASRNSSIIVEPSSHSNEIDSPLIHISSGYYKEGDIQPRRSYMSVRIISSGGRMCVECWSGDHDKDRSGCSTGPTDIRVLSWDFTSGLSTKFWCSAIWGSKYISRFSVFGDGVPKKSSEWKVDHQGKRRTHEDGNVVEDYFRSWSE